MNLPIAIEQSVLSEESWASLNTMAEELSKAYRTRQIFRTETEARVSVLDMLKFPTNAAKYWQCVREQCVMLEQLALLSFEFRKNEVRLKRAQKSSSVIALDAEERQIAIDECLFARQNMLHTAADRFREIAMWSRLKSEVDDGTFDNENVDAHQLVSYMTQFALKASQPTVTGKLTGEELANLTGLLQTTWTRCRELGVAEQVSAALPDEARALLP